LIESGAMRPDQLARALAERFGVDYIDLSVFEIDMGAVHLVNANLASVTGLFRWDLCPIARWCLRWPIQPTC
jgi:hypothetical protein